MAVLCAVGLGILVVRDLFIPSTREVEVWLGFEVTGRAALWSAPIHWAIFAIGAWGFWTARLWIVPLAAAYAFYGAVSHVVWSEASPHGRGWPIGLLQAAAISVLGVLLLRGWAGLKSGRGARA